MNIPPVLLKQFEKRCEELSMTPVEALRNWLDNNPPPPRDTYSRGICNACSALEPTEVEQLAPWAPHVCKLARKTVSHAGQHPALPTPAWCPKLEVKALNEPESWARPYGCKCQTLAQRMTGSGCDECNHG